jgi:hypothetical protein
MDEENSRMVMQTFITITNILEEITKRLDTLENEIAIVSRKLSNLENNQKLSGDQEKAS